jgi:hypothetical protein
VTIDGSQRNIAIERNIKQENLMKKLVFAFEILNNFGIKYIYIYIYMVTDIILNYFSLILQKQEKRHNAQDITLHDYPGTDRTACLGQTSQYCPKHSRPSLQVFFHIHWYATMISCRKFILNTSIKTFHLTVGVKSFISLYQYSR